MVQGNLYVYVNDPAGYFTADDLARIQDTIVNLNDLLAPYSVTITELESTDLSLANVVIDNGITTPLGGASRWSARNLYSEYWRNNFGSGLELVRGFRSGGHWT